MTPQLPAAKVIAYSITRDSPPLVTIQYCAPRFILAEINTHRVFSRSARSSRAVPVSKMLAEVRDDPVLPLHWGRNQPGMQAREEISPAQQQLARDMILAHRDHALKTVQGLSDDCELHKQIANRYLEPFLRVHGVITSTDWANFMALRDHEDAEPHMAALAAAIKDALENAPQQRKYYDPYSVRGWHLPYITPDELVAFKLDDLIMASAARCARVSYKPFDADQADVLVDAAKARAMAAKRPVHASPFEHQARVIPTGVPSGGNFRGWRQCRHDIPNNTVYDDAGRR